MRNGVVERNENAAEVKADQRLDAAIEGGLVAILEREARL